MSDDIGVGGEVPAYVGEETAEEQVRSAHAYLMSLRRRSAMRRMAEAMWRLDSDQIEQIGYTFETAPSNARYTAMAGAAFAAMVPEPPAEDCREEWKP